MAAPGPPPSEAASTQDPGSTIGGDEASVRLRDALLDVPALTRTGWSAAGPVTRWLVASRAAVLALTLFACLFGGLLALPFDVDGDVAGDVDAFLRFLLVTMALLLAHATNNLLNDHVDFRTGLDRDNYFRARYGAHPLAQGLMGVRAHLGLLLATGSVALALAVLICVQLGGAAWWLTLAGGFLLLFYTWPLKHLALGELAVFLVWGPLMCGGVCWAVGGTLSGEQLLLAALYGLGPTVVILAKHTDKLDDDAARGVRTLPVLLGPRVARWSWWVCALVQIGGALTLAIVGGRPGLLLVLATLPLLVVGFRMAAAPRPDRCPTTWPGNLWPLWYTVTAFRFARRAGLMLSLGVLADWLANGG
ncbi:MAG: prenyltransferase [Pseudomonadales bacterium]|nr:prenyltransferase [Pseudomonadales bacterium]